MTMRWAALAAVMVIAGCKSARVYGGDASRPDARVTWSPDGGAVLDCTGCVAYCEVGASPICIPLDRRSCPLACVSVCESCDAAGHISCPPGGFTFDCR